LTSRITKRLQALNKQFLPVFWEAIERKQVWGFFVAAVISAPCAAEPPAVDGAEVAPKLTSGGKVAWVSLHQNHVEYVTTKNDLTVEARKGGGVNSGTEGGGSGSEASLVAVSPSKVGANAEKNNTSNEGFEVHLLIPLLHCALDNFHGRWCF